MTNRNQYRITVNNTPGQIIDTYPDEQWSRIAEASENHTMTATFERRLVSEYQPEIEALYPGMKAGPLYVSHWQTIAEIESR